MDKATKVAGDKYPHGKFDGELGGSLRAACAIGYMQAEKDLALTWEDVWAIGELIDKVKNDFCDNPSIFNLKEVTPENFKQAYAEEVLRRFNEERKK